MIAIQGNTYPVKDALKALGGRWDPDTKVWKVPDDKADEAKALVAKGVAATGAAKPAFRHNKCTECGARPSQYVRIYRNGLCGPCYGDRKNGLDD